MMAIYGERTVRGRKADTEMGLDSHRSNNLRTVPRPGEGTVGDDSQSGTANPRSNSEMERKNTSGFNSHK